MQGRPRQTGVCSTHFTYLENALILFQHSSTILSATLSEMEKGISFASFLFFFTVFGLEPFTLKANTDE